MRKIYYNDSVIIFNSGTGIDCDLHITSDTDINHTKVLQKLEINKCVTINSDNIDAVYDRFCSFFKIVDAAGGLVMNTNGRWLMMKRNGKWDLPKGHRDEGEELEECALREVEEECGVRELQIVRHLITTQHIYPLNGEWILKHTYWYIIKCSDDGQLVPQTEEGITEVRWVERSDITTLLANSYQTIRDCVLAVSRRSLM